MTYRPGKVAKFAPFFLTGRAAGVNAAISNHLNQNQTGLGVGCGCELVCEANPAL
jgi:hypothetical protein